METTVESSAPLGAGPLGLRLGDLAAMIRLAAADWEVHLRALGLEYLRREEEIPAWVFEDLEAALKLQGELG